MQQVYRLASATIFSLFTLGNAVAATNDSYAGIAYHSGTLAFPGGTEYRPTGLEFKGGKYFIENVAVEGRYLISMAGDKKTFVDSTYGYIESEISIASGYALLLRGDLPLSPTASVYGVVGYGSLEVEQTVTVPGLGSGSAKNSESGAVYGFGLDAFDKDFGIYAEYMVYPGSSGDADTTEYDYSSINVGISKRF